MQTPRRRSLWPAFIGVWLTSSVAMTVGFFVLFWTIGVVWMGVSWTIQAVTGARVLPISNSDFNRTRSSSISLLGSAPNSHATTAATITASQFTTEKSMKFSPEWLLRESLFDGGVKREQRNPIARQSCV